jgi:hypothetical protein
VAITLPEGWTLTPNGALVARRDDVRLSTPVEQLLFSLPGRSAIDVSASVKTDPPFSPSGLENARIVVYGLIGGQRVRFGQSRFPEIVSGGLSPRPWLMAQARGGVDRWDVCLASSTAPGTTGIPDYAVPLIVSATTYGMDPAAFSFAGNVFWTRPFTIAGGPREPIGLWNDQTIYDVQILQLVGFSLADDDVFLQVFEGAPGPSNSIPFLEVPVAKGASYSLDLRPGQGDGLFFDTFTNPWLACSSGSGMYTASAKWVTCSLQVR